jgi:MFS transporter, DHA1 family, tetracycline resistance protein
VIVFFWAFGGIAGPAAQALIKRRVTADEQGGVQGSLGSLSSLAAVIAPPLGAWSFGAAIAPGSRLHWPGVSFFEAAVLCLAALAVAMRTLRRDAVPAVVHV